VSNYKKFNQIINSDLKFNDIFVLQISYIFILPQPLEWCYKRRFCVCVCVRVCLCVC